MRRLLLFVVIITMIGATSCQKDWRCECTDKESGESKTVFVIPDKTRSEAKSLCDLYDKDDLICSPK